jgi:hypothetical protein
VARDFKKLGLDRLSQNIATSINKPTGRLVTGDLASGEVVEVEFNGVDLEESVTVSPRRTGAIILEIALDSPQYMSYELDGTTLSVTLPGARTGTIKFWAF